jgi:hypothetical protein
MADDVRPYEVQSDNGISVTLPSGSAYSVMTNHEADYLTDKIERYLSDNHFVNVSDMQDIDKMIVFELLIHRWTLWMSRGRDYYDEDINVKQYSDMASSYSTEVRQLKKALGVDKSTRDRTRGDDSIPAFWDNLLRRAREFGYSRNEQFNQVLVGFQRIKAMITFYDNADEIERKENRCDLEDVFEVIREEIAKFDAIDEKFRFEKQATWIRQM